jgi:hypothetical protein
MGIEGTYRISIEQSAHKRVQGLHETTSRLLGYMGGQLAVPSAERAKHIQQVIAGLRANQATFDGISLAISPASITLTTPDGVMVYRIAGRKEDGPSHMLLSLEADEMGKVQWDATLCNDKFLVFESDDSLSEWVFEKTAQPN